MQMKLFAGAIIITAILISGVTGAFARQDTLDGIKSQEVSEVDGIPVLVKHLPDWENARNRAKYILNHTELREALGERPVFDLISFEGGTEAVAAEYPAGKLLIVEYTTPQFSSNADVDFRQRLSELGPGAQIFYKRIGNYNAFVFDGTDEAAAKALFDQIKYEKTVQWLGTDPTILQRAERAFVTTTADIVFSTLFIIIFGLTVSISGGLVAGFFYYRFREKQRRSMKSFSDAGGIVRLNLDDLTPDLAPDRLLKE